MRDEIILPFRSPSDHLHDRVTCTYEVPPSSEMPSTDPVHVQQTQNSTELTVHLTLSQTESGLATHEIVNDCRKESAYDDMDETDGKSRSGRDGYLEIQEQERKQAMMVGRKKGIEQPPTLCDEKEENKDNVYAVVNKERKGKVSSEAGALKTSPGLPQEETSGLPVNQASVVDRIGRSVHQTESGIDNDAKAAASETPQASGNNEYLYAAVDMTKKKKKPPQITQKKLPKRKPRFGALPKLNMPKKSHERSKPTPRPERSVAKDSEEPLPNSYYKGFTKLCQRVKSLKSFTHWKMKIKGDKIVLKKILDSYVLPQLEIVVDDSLGFTVKVFGSY
ncbi:hypothetical protein AWC38_SpisGene22370 [Stylophora pistillata]|uniref:Uncharacterized protein n=1 Tax=Stylophora pistillata TaxID=50429 RepID=A0A2B4R8R1_STYPI|nr:hypothetical protein AWC38_SpisGene22370 [Stylophora pistillata]